jgi:hypothetical protein
MAASSAASRTNIFWRRCSGVEIADGKLARTFQARFHEEACAIRILFEEEGRLMTEFPDCATKAQANSITALQRRVANALKSKEKRSDQTQSKTPNPRAKKRPIRLAHRSRSVSTSTFHGILSGPTGDSLKSLRVSAYLVGSHSAGHPRARAKFASSSPRTAGPFADLQS